MHVNSSPVKLGIVGLGRWAKVLARAAGNSGKLEIVAGTTVVWKNDDPLDHSVTADDKSFDSGLIRSGATWSRTFTEPGTFPISCTPHPFMKLTVVVKPER